MRRFHSNRAKIVSYAKTSNFQGSLSSRASRPLETFAKTCRSVGVSSSLAINLNNKWVSTASKKSPTQREDVAEGLKDEFTSIPLMKTGHEIKNTVHYLPLSCRIKNSRNKGKIPASYVEHPDLFRFPRNLPSLKKIILNILVVIFLIKNRYLCCLSHVNFEP